ncbi:hypothetical protein HDV01_002995 [Terramyces sp. JEL0728]|nr:hypothetical protein HDV01_002995 [Terramyces sp. JEL0728]
MISLLISIAAAQSTSNSTVSSLCTTNPSSVYCQIYTQACSSTQSSGQICTKLFPAFLYAMCTNDFPKGAACQSIPTVITTAVSAVPSTKQVQSDVTSLCKEMPSMTACKSCPDATSSSCDLMGTFSSICSQMPMTDCADLVKLCSSAVGTSLSYCTGVLAANPSSNSTSTAGTTSAVSPTVTSDAGRTFVSYSLIFLTLLV